MASPRGACVCVCGVSCFHEGGCLDLTTPPPRILGSHIILETQRHTECQMKTYEQMERGKEGEEEKIKKGGRKGQRKRKEKGREGERKGEEKEEQEEEGKGEEAGRGGYPIRTEELRGAHSGHQATHSGCHPASPGPLAGQV